MKTPAICALIKLEVSATRSDEIAIWNISHLQKDIPILISQCNLGNALHLYICTVAHDIPVKEINSQCDRKHQKVSTRFVCKHMLRFSGYWSSPKF